MRFLKKHWEKLLLALFVVAVCGWGIYLFIHVVTLQEQVIEQEVVRGKVAGIRLDPFSREDFTALRYVQEARREWRPVERDDRASLIRPEQLIWCVRPDCDYWLPANQEICPHCLTDQGEHVVELPDIDEDRIVRPLEQRLFLVNVSREDFGAVLRRLTAVAGQPPESWDVQIEVVEADGRRRTRFVRKGDSIDVQGVEFRVVEIERKEETRFNPAINAEETIDRSEIVLEGPGERRIRLVRGERKRVGPHRVSLLLTDPRDPRFSRSLTVRSDQTLSFRDVDGSRRNFDVVVRRDNLVILRDADVEDPEPLRIEPRPRRGRQQAMQPGRDI